MNFRIVAVFLLAWVFCPIARADVTIKGSNVTKETSALGMMGPDAVAGLDVALGTALDQLGLGDEFQEAGLGEQLQENVAPGSTTDGFTIYIKDGWMRMDSGGGRYSMIIGPKPGASRFHMYMRDHQDKNVFLWGGMAQSAEAVSRTQTVGDDQQNYVRPAGATREISVSGVSYTAEKIEYRVWGSAGTFQDLENPENRTGANVYNEGAAWVSPHAPGAEEVREFYASFTAFGTGPVGLTGGLMSAMSRLAEHGMPLEVVTETSVDVQGPGMSGQPLGKSVTTTTVAEIFSDPLPADIFFDYVIPEGYAEASMSPETESVGPAQITASESAPEAETSQDTPDNQEGCDCSCEAFAALQEMGKKKQKGSRPQSDPEAMRMAMCAASCMTKWTACAKAAAGLK